MPQHSIGKRPDSQWEQLLKGIKPSPTKIKAIHAFLERKNKSALRNFLDILTYLGRFITNLATRTVPLRELLKDTTPWIWEETHGKCFSELKESISQESSLAHYDQQSDCRGQRFGRNASTKTEQKYNQIEKEVLAVFWGREKFHIYLETLLTTLQSLT